MQPKDYEEHLVACPACLYKWTDYKTSTKDAEALAMALVTAASLDYRQHPEVLKAAEHVLRLIQNIEEFVK